MATGSDVTPREILEAQGKLLPNVIAVRAKVKGFDLHTPASAGVAVDPTTTNDGAAGIG